MSAHQFLKIVISVFHFVLLVVFFYPRTGLTGTIGLVYHWLHNSPPCIDEPGVVVVVVEVVEVAVVVVNHNNVCDGGEEEEVEEERKNREKKTER